MKRFLSFICLSTLLRKCHFRSNLVGLSDNIARRRQLLQNNPKLSTSSEMTAISLSDFDDSDINISSLVDKLEGIGGKRRNGGVTGIFEFGLANGYGKDSRLSKPLHITRPARNAFTKPSLRNTDDSKHRPDEIFATMRMIKSTSTSASMSTSLSKRRQSLRYHSSGTFTPRFTNNPLVILTTAATTRPQRLTRPSTQTSQTLRTSTNIFPTTTRMNIIIASSTQISTTMSAASHENRRSGDPPLDMKVDDKIVTSTTRLGPILTESTHIRMRPTKNAANSNTVPSPIDEVDSPTMSTSGASTSNNMLPTTLSNHRTTALHSASSTPHTIKQFPPTSTLTYNSIDLTKYYYTSAIYTPKTTNIESLTKPSSSLPLSPPTTTIPNLNTTLTFSTTPPKSSSSIAARTSHSHGDTVGSTTSLPTTTLSIVPNMTTSIRRTSLNNTSLINLLPRRRGDITILAIPAIVIASIVLFVCTVSQIWSFCCNNSRKIVKNDYMIHPPGFAK